MVDNTSVYNAMREKGPVNILGAPETIAVEIISSESLSIIAGPGVLDEMTSVGFGFVERGG